jgi:[histone H3]-lysine79 N-trimethyltransferase
MAGLDFFGAKTSNNASGPTVASSAAAAAVQKKKKALLTRPPLPAASSSRSTPVSSSSSPASPRRIPGPHSSSNRAAAPSATSLTAATHRKGTVSSASSPASQASSPAPTPASTASGTANPIRRPAVVIVKTFATASKPRTSASLLSSTAPASKTVKHNALPEERRLRIAQEQKQRRLEQEQKEHAERRRAEAAREATRPLKKRRTLSSASGSKRSSPVLSPVSDRKSRSRTLFSDDDDTDDDNSYSTHTKHNAAAKDDWIIPPRQSRSVIRPDEEDAVKEVQNSAVADEVRNAAGISSGVTRFTSPCQRAVSSLSVVTSTGLKVFAPYFKDIDDHTIVTLEYPAVHGSEAFPLLVPKPLDEYDPISDLLRTVHVMVSSYFPDEAVRTKLFGRLEELEFTGGRLHPRDSSSPGPAPTTSLHPGHVTPLGSTSASAIVNGAHLSPLSTYPSRASTPLHLTPSVSSQGMNASVVSGGGVPATRLATPQPGVATAPSTAQSTPAASSTSLSNLSNSTGSITAPLAGTGTAAAASTLTQMNEESILRSFQRARNRRNGPLFLRTVARFNETMRSAKRSGLVLDGIRKMSESGIPERLWANIHEQCYARIVGPKVEELNHYTAFSDNV